MTLGQIAILSLCNEMDVKGTLSGKRYIFNLNGSAGDILGHMLLRLGYVGEANDAYYGPLLFLRGGGKPVTNGPFYVCYATGPSGVKECAFSAAKRELGIGEGIHEICLEIDRFESTNDSIRQKIKQVCNIKD